MSRKTKNQNRNVTPYQTTSTVRYGEYPLRPKARDVPPKRIKGLGRDIAKYRAAKRKSNAYLASAGRSLFFRVLATVCLILIVFAVVLYPMNRTLPYEDQLIVSTDDYLSQLSSDLIFFDGHEVQVDLTDTNVFDHYGMIYIDVSTPDGLKSEMFESLNYYDDLDIITSGNAVFEFYVHGQYLKSYVTAVYEDYAQYCVYVNSFTDTGEPDASEFLYTLKRYSAEQGESGALFKFSDVLDRGLVYISDCISYGLNMAHKLLPQNIAKPRRDFGVTIPWRC